MRIGIIGAGKIGSTVGKLWVDAGHQVKFSSRHPEELQSMAEAMGASAGTPAEAAAFGEVVMITVPLKAMPELAREVGAALKGDRSRHRQRLRPARRRRRARGEE